MSHALIHELQEREMEEHLGQLLRKLSTKDNSVDRRNLRNKVRNKFPATKKIASGMYYVYHREFKSNASLFQISPGP